jgi:hypothetical protein
VVEKAARKIALDNENAETEEQETKGKDEKTLVSLLNMEMVTPMIDLALLLNPQKSKHPVYALQVVDDAHTNDNKLKSKKILDKAVSYAAATDHEISPIIRHDANIANGIIYTIKEQNITDTLMGLHQNADQKTFFGPTAEKLLRRIWNTLYIYKPLQPLNTFQRIIVAVPANAEKEPGFAHWFEKITVLAKSLGLPVHFYAPYKTQEKIKTLHENSTSKAQIQLKEFNSWDDFLMFSKELKNNDLFIIISARKGTVSYSDDFKKLPYYLTRYFNEHSFIVLYPEQFNTGINMENIEQVDGTLLETLTERIGALGNAGKIFKKVFMLKEGNKQEAEENEKEE